MSKPVFTDQRIADQLTRDGMRWYGGNGDNVIQYSFSASLGYWWSNDSETALDATQQGWVENALQQLEEMFNIDFREVAEPANTSSQYPLDIIQFVNDTGTGTYSSSYTYGDGRIAFNAIVFDQNWSSNQPANLSYGSYGYMTILHEVLHSLGLEHPGDYNAGSSSTPITYQNSAEFEQDTHRYTVMSYFNAISDGSGAVHYDTVTRKWVYPSTPMVYDILAMTSGAFAGAFAGYGYNTATRNGDTVYGYNASASADPVYDFSANTAPVLTVYDTGGIDTLDLSGDTVSQQRVVNYNPDGSVASYSQIARTSSLIDLREGEYSSTHGMTYNIGIAFGTLIENVIGTIFDDEIIGNAAANTIIAGDGDDTVDSGGGNDLLIGGLGADIHNGGAGFDTVDYSQADAGVRVDLRTGFTGTGSHAEGDVNLGIEAVIGSAHADTLIGNIFNNVLEGGDGNDQLDGLRGNDQLLGGAGNDLLIGAAGNDFMDGGTGIDIISYLRSASAVFVSLQRGVEGVGGDADGDTMIRIENVAGSQFADELIGNIFNNRIAGRAGDDFIAGMAGNDQLFGGTGSDTFHYGSGHGHDTIFDFASAEGDMISLADMAGVSQYSDLLEPDVMTQIGNDTLIVFSDLESILLKNVLVTELGSGDFLF